MKRIGGLSRMKWRMLLLVFLAGYTADVAAQEVNEAASPIEFNPHDYVPLAVGNRWMYEHFYVNVLHGTGEPFDIPGYPPGSLPDSLKIAYKTGTIEVTHTEVIDGSEYFVFSDADYAWPPLPNFFWGGKKVRLSDEGFLVFRWNGQDISVYDFGHNSKHHEYKYIGTLPIFSSTVEDRFNRLYAESRLSMVSFSFANNYYGIGRSSFLQGYGMGLAYIYVEGTSRAILFQNVLVPISATISGEEIIYEQVRPFYDPHFESTGLGQVGQVRMGEGFDFSEGKSSKSYSDFGLMMSNPWAATPGGALSRSFPHLSSKTGVDDLGKINFSLPISLISEGIPPNLQLGFPNSVFLTEGHTYAVRSHEGGIALLYVFDVEFEPESARRTPFLERHIKNITFDWVYYPDGMPDADTSVRPISWGQLKHLTPKRRSTSQDTLNR